MIDLDSDAPTGEKKNDRRTCRLAEEAIPGLTLRTTVIVGFPGESEDDFGQMLELLEEIQFERVGAFTYSVEEGTRAEKLPDHVPQDTMDERLEELGNFRERSRLREMLCALGERQMCWLIDL